MTLSIGGTPDERHREAIDEAVRALGGRTTWRVHPQIARSYASIESDGPIDARAIGVASDAQAYESAIIALAVSPAVPQALPGLQKALGGAGRPAGVLACRSFSGGVVVEWDPNVTSTDIVLGLIDVELRRFASGRTVEVLAPLPKPVIAKIAAHGLQAPQIGLDRVLEELVGDA
jgi:hypothetical protein